MNTDYPLVLESRHEGRLPQVDEGIRVSSRTVIASVLKRAEEDGGYVLRCYECAGHETETMIEIPCLGKKWCARFGAWEIKTFYVPDNREDIVEVNLVEMPSSP